MSVVNEPIGNGAAMRDALEEIVGIVSEWQGSIPLGKVCKIAKAALSAPPKNSDIGTADEQAERLFRQHGDTTIGAKVALAWAQMPYEKGGAS